MNRCNLLAAAALGCSVAACSYSSETTTQAAATTRPMTGSEQACLDYGFTPGTTAYGNCVSREAEQRALAARGYRAQPTVTTIYNAPASPPPPPAAYVETRGSPAVGVEAFRDEYGYRYDAYGNRLDARGNIVSPHSRTRY